MNTTTVIVNYTDAMIFLPGTESYPSGDPATKLRPGENNVPNRYLEELEALEVQDIKGRTRYPGRDTLEQLQQSVMVHSYDRGSAYRPRIAILRDGAQGRESPMKPPASLDGYSEQGALALIEAVSDKSTLEAWAKTSKGAVKAAATAKLKGMGG